MIISTTGIIEGSPVKEYKGIVFGETIIGANIFKDILAGIRDIIGGRSGAYERVMMEARETSLREMKERAEETGANAIIGVKVDYETVGTGNGMMMVVASGTAVII
jgi:uncharacterized protein YbjQ (UPF0145 family)